MIYDRDALTSDSREGAANDRVFRIGVLGCGRISDRHFEAIQTIDGLELAGVCDVVAARARQASERFGAPMFATYDKLLNETGIDAIVIATPSGLHAEQGVLAAKHGKHVITEKPMAITLDGADALVSACDNAGVHLFVVKQNRLNPSIQLLRRAIDKGRFGRLYLVNCTVRWSRPQEYYDQASWRGTWEFDGGAFMNQASHYIDLLQWLVGSVESVMAKTATLARRIETEDTGVAILKFRSGALGVIEVTMLAFPHNLEGSITILGEQGSVKIGGTAVNKVEHWEFSEYDDDDKLVEAANTAPPDVYGFGHYRYYRNVLAVLRGAAAPDTDGRAGRKSLELILGMYESAREGCEIRLPLQRSGSAERSRPALSRS